MIKERNKGSIYELARSAKERLKSNNYLKTASINTSISTASSVKSYIQNTRPNTVQVFKPTTNGLDDALYKKVCEMLDSGQEYLNPVSELIDRKFFNSLDFGAKQHYINTLIEKYKQLKQRYYKERFSFNNNLLVSTN